jgi:hypothetical protein
MANEKVEMVTISPPKFNVLTLKLTGTSPYMQSKFPAKVEIMMREKMMAGSTAGKGKKREPRDFDADFLGAQHISSEGWIGIPASAFRIAAVDACRVCGFKMTIGKMSIFAEADGLDAEDATPLVRLEAPAPEVSSLPVRNATGVVDIRVRPMWREWGCTLRLTYDGDQFTKSDVVNLMTRVGVQVGVGEGRPFSKSSCGLGFGTFKVEPLEG